MFSNDSTGAENFDHESYCVIFQKIVGMDIRNSFTGNVVFELTCSSSTLPTKATATWNFDDGNQSTQVVNSTALEMTNVFLISGSGNRNSTYHVKVNISNTISSKEVSAAVSHLHAFQNILYD